MQPTRLKHPNAHPNLEVQSPLYKWMPPDESVPDESVGDDSVSAGMGADDKPVVFWAHANGYSAGTYAPLLAPLANDTHVYAWDARGHGRSTLPAVTQTHHSWHIYSQDLIKTLEEIYARHKRPVLVAGHSMGATTTILAAEILGEKAPDLIAGLVLVEPVVFPLAIHYLNHFIHRLPFTAPANAMVLGALRRKDFFASAAEMRARFENRGGFKSWQDGFLDAYIESATYEADGGLRLACTPAWEAANFHAHGHNIIRAARRLNVPFSLLAGAHHSTVLSRRVFQKHKQCQNFEVVADTSHFLPMEQPEKVREAIRGFF